MRVKTPLNDADFKAIVRAVLAVSQPAAIVLFGSYARGEAHDFSDVDLLVIRDNEFGSGESRRKELGKLYRSVSAACDLPKDILLFTKNEFLSWKETTNHMASVAWREGRVLYGQI